MEEPDPFDYLRLVRHHARKIALSSSESFEDLYQEGCIGLLKACKKYRPTPDGIKFGTYAHKWIRGEMLHYIGRQIGRKDQGQFRPKASHKAIRLDGLIDAESLFPDWNGYDQTLIAEEWEALSMVWQTAWEKDPIERQALELCVLGGLKQREAAELLGVGLMTLNRRLKVAIAHLRMAYLSATRLGHTTRPD